MREHKQLHHDETHDSDDDPSKPFLEHRSNRRCACVKKHASLWIYCLVALLIATDIVISVLYTSRGVRSTQNAYSTPYAGLTYDTPRTWTPLHGGNETEEEQFWHVETDYSAGHIALSNEYVAEIGLPTAQRFLWDDGKGIYILNAYHGLHCLRLVRESLVQFRAGTAQTRTWAHVLHCLRALRDDITCTADDTPRYTGMQAPHNSGLGQTRMCRDWTALQRWAAERSACYRSSDGNGDYDSLDMYRHCPPGSPYAEPARSKWLGVQPPQTQSRHDDG